MRYIKIFELFGKHEDLIRLTEEEYEEEITRVKRKPTIFPEKTFRILSEVEVGSPKNYGGKWTPKVRKSLIYSWFDGNVNGVVVELCMLANCTHPPLMPHNGGCTIRTIEIFINDDEYYITNVDFCDDEPEMCKCDGIDGLLDFIKEVASW